MIASSMQKTGSRQPHRANSLAHLAPQFEPISPRPHLSTPLFYRIRLPETSVLRVTIHSETILLGVERHADKPTSSRRGPLAFLDPIISHRFPCLSLFRFCGFQVPGQRSGGNLISQVSEHAYLQPFETQKIPYDTATAFGVDLHHQLL